MVSELSYKVVGCAMRVHSELGSGFPEIIYSRALAIELIAAGLEFEQEQDKEVYYKGEWVGTRRVDFVVEDELLVEIKATTEIEAGHFVQVKNYVKVFDVESGLLINFGKPSLEYRTIRGY